MGDELDCVLNEQITEDFLRRCQIVIFWHNPLAVGVTWGVVDTGFYLIYRLNLDCVSASVFLLTFCSVVAVIMRILDGVLEKIVFRELFGSQDTSEITEAIQLVQNKVIGLIVWIHEYIREPTVRKHVLFFGIMLPLCLVFKVCGSFWCCFAFVHCILIVPGLLSVFRRLFVREKEKQS